MEYNLNAVASLALEGTFIGKSNEYSEKDAEETGEQISSKGSAVGIFVSRYTQPNAMAGFFWTLGAGYRQVQADWQAPFDEGDPANKDSLRFQMADEESRFHHNAEAKGMTGTGRIGYRYVGSEWPLTIGAYVGIRHFQNKVADRGDDETTSDGDKISEMSDKEKTRLQNRYRTGFEPGLEFGFVF
jgi:hypothetical protein